MTTPSVWRRPSSAATWCHAPGTVHCGLTFPEFLAAAVANADLWRAVYARATYRTRPLRAPRRSADPGIS